MTTERWWARAIIYQLYPMSFADSDGDGVGDLDGIVERLGYLTDTLGVDAVWLSPFYPSPMADHGYDVADYTDVNPLFGDLEAFDRLVEKAHERGLRVIVDWVPNHTSDQHPWFVESRSSRQSPKRDWYYWRDPQADGSPPNNWVSVVDGPAWQFDHSTGQYYMHTYLPQQPDLNWRCAGVREAMFEVLRFWLDRGVDGFRIDVAHRIMKDPALRDNPPNSHGISDYHKPVGRDYLSQLHVHDRAHPDVHRVYRDIRRLLDGYGHDPVALGEIHLAEIADWARFYGADLDELHLPLNFRLMGAPWEPAAIARAVESVDDAIPSGAAPTLVLGNHDDHRLATKIGPEQARVAAMLLLTLRGVPLVYQGDELGMTDVDIPADRRRDQFGRSGGRWSRDGARTPMQWSSARHAGFCPPETDSTWLPVSPDYGHVNVEAQLADPDSLLSLYRRLISYRKTSRALLEGVYRPFAQAPPACLAYLRETDDERLLVALNFSGEKQEIELESAGEVVLSTHAENKQALKGSLVLEPNEGACVVLIQ